MVFCNVDVFHNPNFVDGRHNPYFNRWFSAIKTGYNISHDEVTRHNPYFNRWFSAINHTRLTNEEKKGHNPYFNRWFSAIRLPIN